LTLIVFLLEEHSANGQQRRARRVPVKHGEARNLRMVRERRRAGEQKERRRLRSQTREWAFRRVGPDHFKVKHLALMFG